MTREQAIRDYNNATATTLYGIYKEPSHKKKIITDRIHGYMNKDNGNGIKFSKINSMYFNVFYLFSDKDTGVIKLAYFTPWNYYEFDF